MMRKPAGTFPEAAIRIPRLLQLSPPAHPDPDFTLGSRSRSRRKGVRQGLRPRAGKGEAQASRHHPGLIYSTFRADTSSNTFANTEIGLCRPGDFPSARPPLLLLPCLADGQG